MLVGNVALQITVFDKVVAVRALFCWIVFNRAPFLLFSTSTLVPREVFLWPSFSTNFTQVRSIAAAWLHRSLDFDAWCIARYVLLLVVKTLLPMRRAVVRLFVVFRTLGVIEDKNQHRPAGPVLMVSLAHIVHVLFVRSRKDLAVLWEAPDNAPLVALNHVFKPNKARVFRNYQKSFRLRICLLRVLQFFDKQFANQVRWVACYFHAGQILRKRVIIYGVELFAERVGAELVCAYVDKGAKGRYFCQMRIDVWAEHPVFKSWVLLVARKFLGVRRLGCEWLWLAGIQKEGLFLWFVERH